MIFSLLFDFEFYFRNFAYKEEYKAQNSKTRRKFEKSLKEKMAKNSQKIVLFVEEGF